MKRRFILCGLLAASALVILLSVPARAHAHPQPQASQPEQVGPIKDLSSLLNYPHDVKIQNLAGAEKQHVLTTLLTRPEAIQLRRAMAEKGFFPAQSSAEAMRVTVQGEGKAVSIDAVVVPMGPGQRIFLPLTLRNYLGSPAPLASDERSDETQPPPSPEQLSAYLVAMVATDGTSFFQAHHTNLDPRLAELPDPPIIVNGMPYFYITTLQIVNGRIVYWRYWWYNSNNHPNWYYAYYQFYWGYYSHMVDGWPWWHHWAYGWIYWRFWYYWSTLFPWLVPSP
jgi:hypothetical protein